jgi:hypothetical protein
VDWQGHLSNSTWWHADAETACLQLLAVCACSWILLASSSHWLVVWQNQASTALLLPDSKWIIDKGNSQPAPPSIKHVKTPIQIHRNTDLLQLLTSVQK